MSLPRIIDLMTQRVPVTVENDLREEPDCPDEGGHRHALFGVYRSATRSIALDDSMGFEKQRETFLHENLHLMFDLSGIDHVLNGQAAGLDEYVASALAPVLMAWLRENPDAIAYLTETQP